MAIVGDSAFLWEFSGTTDDHDKILSAFAAAAEMSDDEVAGDDW